MDFDTRTLLIADIRFYAQILSHNLYPQRKYANAMNGSDAVLFRHIEMYEREMKRLEKLLK